MTQDLTLVATIHALDQRSTISTRLIPAAFAWAIQYDPAQEPYIKDADGFVAKGSAVWLGLVFATLTVVAASPNEAEVLMRTTNPTFAETVNTYRQQWRKGCSPSGVEVSEAGLWMLIGKIERWKSLKLQALPLSAKFAQRDKVFKGIKKLATSQRDEVGLAIGSPLSGFGQKP